LEFLGPFLAESAAKEGLMFNTLRYAKMLEEVGFSRQQAETSVKILVEIMEDKLASKQDLKDLHVATRQELQDFQVATKQDLLDHQVATKQDLQEHRVATKQELKDHRLATNQDLKDHRLATSRDIQDLRTETKQEFRDLRLEMDNRFTQVDAKFVLLESRLTVKMGTMLAASIAILTAIQKLT
jgi:hypothetical protein